MADSEIVVWSALLGGLLTLLALAGLDVLSNRSRGAVRNLLFVLVTGASCWVMTGLPEWLWPDLSQRFWMVLKASLGPVAGAMALHFLGSWLGGVREGVWVHRLTVWGGALVLLAATLLAAVASQLDAAHFQPLLRLTAALNMAPVLLGALAVGHSARLGDPLARWMALAVALLALMVCGFYLPALQWAHWGLVGWVLTAVVTMAFFLLATVLVMLRNRENRQLARLARLEQGAEPATGLPTGSGLLAQVDHVLWRTARRQGECTVICVYLSNLYEMAEPSGPGAEHQILVAMSARIRRAAGFRCVVGLYHPRCFVVVLPTDPRNAPATETVERLRCTAAQPVLVQDATLGYQTFEPCVGLGVVTVRAFDATSMELINTAEREAMDRLHRADASFLRGAQTRHTHPAGSPTA